MGGDRSGVRIPGFVSGPSRSKGLLARILALPLLALLAAEGALQLPPVREAIRARAEATLHKKIPEAGIARCSAADVTGTVRFDGVSVPLGRVSAVFDGLEVSLSLPALLHGKVKPERIGAATLTLTTTLPAGGRAVWIAAGDSGRASGLPVSLRPGGEGEPTVVSVDGPSRLCRLPDGEAPTCGDAAVHLEGSFLRGPEREEVDFQAIGDQVSLDSGEGPERLPVPALGMNGKLVRGKDWTTLAADLSVGPEADLAVHGSDKAGELELDVEGKSKSFAAFADSLPLDLHAVHELGVDGPVSGQVTVRGRLDEPKGWLVDAEVDLKGLKSRARADRSPLTGPFLYQPAADPDAPSIRMAADNPDFVPLSRLPTHVVHAVLLSEDSEFWKHKGFDFQAMADAVRLDLKEKRVHRGGSTITQQLAKNLWLSRERSLRRKVAEALLALALEAAVPKQRILEIYLNAIEWGPKVYGISAAARHYFGKRPEELDPREAAFLASIIPNPKLYHEWFEQGAVPAYWDQKLDWLLDKMMASGALSEASWSQAQNERLHFAGHRAETGWDGPFEQ